MTMKAVIRINVYNQDKYIAQCLESALHQSEDDINIIVVDNGSDDKTQNIVTQYEHLDSRIHYLRIEKPNAPTFDEKILIETTYEILLDPSYADYFMELPVTRSMSPDFIKEAEKYYGADIIIGKPSTGIKPGLFESIKQRKYSSEEFETLYYALNEDVGILYPTTMYRGILDIAKKYYPDLEDSNVKTCFSLLCELDCSIALLRENTCYPLDAFDSHPRSHIDVDSTFFLESGSKYNNLASRTVDKVVIDKENSFTFFAHGYIDCYQLVLLAAEDRDPNFKINLAKNLVMYYFMDTVALAKDDDYMKDMMKRYLDNFAKDELLLSHFRDFISRWYLMQDSDDDVIKKIIEYTLLTDDDNPYNFGTEYEGTLRKFDINDFISKWNQHDDRIDDVLANIRAGKTATAFVIDSDILEEKPFNHEAITLRMMLDSDQHNQRLLKSLEYYIFKGGSTPLGVSKEEDEKKSNQPMLKPHKKLF